MGRFIEALKDSAITILTKPIEKKISALWIFLITFVLFVSNTFFSTGQIFSKYLENVDLERISLTTLDVFIVIQNFILTLTLILLLLVGIDSVIRCTKYNTDKIAIFNVSLSTTIGELGKIGLSIWMLAEVLGLKDIKQYLVTQNWIIIPLAVVSISIIVDDILKDITVNYIDIPKALATNPKLNRERSKQ